MAALVLRMSRCDRGSMNSMDDIYYMAIYYPLLSLSPAIIFERQCMHKQGGEGQREREKAS